MEDRIDFLLIRGIRDEVSTGAEFEIRVETYVSTGKGIAKRYAAGRRILVAIN